MVKRFSWKKYAYLAFAFLVLLSCWESNRSNVMLVQAGTAGAAEGRSGMIPKESIRLRILANSDAPADQWIKRQVRDAVIQQMNTWVAAPQGIEAAREVVRGHLPELEAVVEKTLRSNGFDDAYSVELGVVPFPTKMYGNEVYPAGDYEALRISIGEAKGQNWWCVLFPPLCFVDSELIAKKEINTAYAAAIDEREANEDRLEAGSEAVYTGKREMKETEMPIAERKEAVAKTGTAANTEKSEAGKNGAAAGTSSRSGKASGAATVPVQAGKTSKAAATSVQPKAPAAMSDVSTAEDTSSADANIPAATKTAKPSASPAGAVEKPEIRFFLWDAFKQAVSWLS